MPAGLRPGVGVVALRQQPGPFFRDLHPGPAGHHEERRCEIGASELTMPADRIRRFMTDRPAITFNVINECADDSGVSKDAVVHRLVHLSDQPVCYLVPTMGRIAKQEQFDLGLPALRVVSWALSASWPDQKPYRGLAFSRGSLVADAFEAEDLRVRRTLLGTNHRDGVFDIQAFGCRYERRGLPSRQVSVLLRR